MRNSYHSGFSLLELIFSIMVISVLAGLLLPKLFNTSTHAQVTAVKSDLRTIVSSLQSYYLIHSKIDRLSDVLQLSNQRWELSTLEAIYRENSHPCLKIEVNQNNRKDQIVVTLYPTVGNLCETLYNEGIRSTVYELN